jgi:hypothetical protein
MILVQSNGNAQTTAQGVGPISISQAFSSNNAASNGIVVFVFVLPEFSPIPSITNTGCADTQGNVYTQVLSYSPGFRQTFVFAFVAQNIHAGANTVTFSATAGASNAEYLGILIAEYSGMPAIVRGAAAKVGSGFQTEISQELAFMASTDVFYGSYPFPSGSHPTTGGVFGWGLGGSQMGVAGIDFQIPPFCLIYPPAVPVQGLQFAVGDGGSPENFSLVANIESIDATMSTRTTDVTREGDGPWQRYAATLLQGGTITLQLWWVQNDPNTNAGQVLRALWANRTLTDFQIHYPRSPTCSAVSDAMSGYVTGFKWAAKAGDAFRATVEITVSGQPALDLSGIRVCACMENNMLGIWDSDGYTFTLAFTTADALPGGGYLQLWSPS